MGSVTFREVRKSYPKVGGAKGEQTQVIQGLNLDIKDGEFMVFIGPSGCGKSTTLRMIAGLESVSSGELLIDGAPVNDTPPSQRGVAMVFQSYALYPHMTVAENMGFALKMDGLPKIERVRQVRQVAEVLQITHLLDRLPKDLSGGQRQRVAIGRAIVRKPKVFLFDEPLSNLDASLRVHMRIELARLHKELGTTMIYVTHDQVEAMTLGQRIAVFHEGRIEQVGAPLDLYERPANEFVAGFLGSPKINLIERPGAQDSLAHRLLWQKLIKNLSPEAAIQNADELQKMGVRAEHWQVAKPAADSPVPGSGELGSGVPCELVLSEHLGDSALLYLKVDGIKELITARLSGDDLPNRNQWAPGQALSLEVKPHRTLGFKY
jgi:multiple sugar transport system ATP-binding protein